MLNYKDETSILWVVDFFFLKIEHESHDKYVYVLSHAPPPPPSPPHIYASKCMYVYVHICLFLPECACTTIIDISPRIFKLIYCCCVSIIIVICIVVVNQS